MRLRPNKRVYLLAKNLHDGRTKSVTLYDADCEEVIEWIRANAGDEAETKPLRRRRKR